MQKQEFQTSLDWCKQCDHLERLEDEREGYDVCITCGLVMDPIYSVSISYVNNNCLNWPQYDIKNEWNCLKKEENDLYTLCDKLHLCTSTKQKIFETWRSIKNGI